MDLFLSIIEQCKDKISKDFYREMLPNKLVDIWEKISIYDAKKLKIPELELLNQHFYLILAGGYSAYVCGFTRYFHDIDLFGFIPKDTDVVHLINKTGVTNFLHSDHTSPDRYINPKYAKDENDILYGPSTFWGYTFYSKRPYHQIVIRSEGNEVTTIDANGRRHKCTLCKPNLRLILFHEEDESEMKSYHEDPLYFAQKCIEQTDLEICKCAGIPLENGRKYLFLNLGCGSPDLTQFPISQFANKDNSRAKITEMTEKIISRKHQHQILYEGVREITKNMSFEIRKQIFRKTSIRLRKYRKRVSKKHTQNSLYIENIEKLRHKLRKGKMLHVK